MELLNPLMLWGSLGILIPILIHFWHQKKGKVIEWAATQFLIEKTLQQSRGIRLDNILLLIVRCLLLILLSFFLSKQLLKWLNEETVSKKIHLIQPNTLVLENYKFEIENALKKGEKCYWLDTKNTSIKKASSAFNLNLNPSPQEKDFTPSLLERAGERLNANLLQNSLNEISKTIDNEHIELYFINQTALSQLPNIYVPTNFTTHFINDSNRVQSKPFLSFSANKNIFIDAKNQLASQAIAPTNGKIKHEGLLKVLLTNDDKIEKQSIKATLNALKEIYQFEFQINEKAEENTQYDIVFANRFLTKNLNARILYIYSNADNFNSFSIEKNVVFIPKLLKPQASEIVFNGNLPEFLGEKIIQHFELQNIQQPLSNQQIQTLFKVQDLPQKAINAWFSKIILLIFILLLSFERWLAIHKNA